MTSLPHAQGLMGAQTEDERAAFDAQMNEARARFDGSTDFTLGVEEEFAICDPESLDLVPRFEDVAQAAREAGLATELAGELLAAEVEFRTGRCDSWAAAQREVLDIRQRVMAVARTAGVKLAASATHPWADYREQEMVRLDYYDRLVERMQWAARRNNTFGLHVHVGVCGGDRAIRVADALRTYQPLLLALSASSPFVDGVDTQLASARHMIFSRNFIRGNVAPIFETLDGYLAHLGWLRDSGAITTSGQVWWGTRPHIQHGTVELRMFDGQPDVRDTMALVALACGTIAHLCELDDARELPAAVATPLVEENCWRAARWGTDATFAQLPSAEPVSGVDAIGGLIQRARDAGARAGLGIDTGLDRAEAMLERGCSATWQRGLAQAGGGDLRRAFDAVVDVTMGVQGS